VIPVPDKIAMEKVNSVSMPHTLSALTLSPNGGEGEEERAAKSRRVV
jgi:hypothetical protein